MHFDMEARRRAALIAFGLGLGLVLALAGAEVWFRLAGAPFRPDVLRAGSLEYRPANLARHVLAPGPRTVRQGDLVQRISERGYRGDPFTLEKPEGVVRIAVLGGSAAFDIYAGEGRDWPARAEAELRSRGLNVEVLNLGVPGHASWDAAGRLLGEAWMFEPDYVLLYNCWNDLKYFSWLGPDSTLLRTRVPGPDPGDQNPYLHPVNRLDALLLGSRAYAWLRWRYLRLRLPTGPEGRRPEPAPLQDDFPDWGPKQYELTLRVFVEAARAGGAEPLLATQARLPTASNEADAGRRIRYDYAGLTHDALVRAFEACDAGARRVSAERRVPLLDLSELNGQDTLFQDHVHFRAPGSRLAGARLADFLDDVLRER